MLGKLLKHEWKSVWKIPTILLCVLMGLAVLAGLGFASPIWDSGLEGLGVLAVLSWMVFYFGSEYRNYAVSGGTLLQEYVYG